MAKFKKPHFEIIATVVNRMSGGKTVCNRTLNVLVDQLVLEFATDNPRFNETLFRSQCGSWITKRNLIIKSETITNG